MTRHAVVSALRIAALAIALALPLVGCAYDYWQHTDRVGYGVGDAVRANIESQTVDPSKASMNDVSGLGKNGATVPAVIVQP